MAATPTIAEPLTQQDLKDLNKAQYLLNQLIPQLEKAAAAGRDVTDLQLRRDDLAAQVQQLKAAYFPASH